MNLTEESLLLMVGTAAGWIFVSEPPDLTTSTDSVEIEAEELEWPLDLTGLGRLSFLLRMDLFELFLVLSIFSLNKVCVQVRPDSWRM